MIYYMVLKAHLRQTLRIKVFRSLLSQGDRCVCVAKSWLGVLASHFEFFISGLTVRAVRFWVVELSVYLWLLWVDIKFRKSGWDMQFVRWVLV